jgi:hypothetical protein
MATKQFQHYHVLVGIPGCMPDDNQVFTNRKDAVSYAISAKEDYKEQGFKVSGSNGDYEAVARDSYAMRTVETCPCQEEDCLLYED